MLNSYLLFVLKGDISVVEYTLLLQGNFAVPSYSVLQTLFSLYLYNQWTYFDKLSCTIKPQIRAIYTYMGCTKATTNN